MARIGKKLFVEISKPENNWFTMWCGTLIAEFLGDEGKSSTLMTIDEHPEWWIIRQAEGKERDPYTSMFHPMTNRRKIRFHPSLTPNTENFRQRFHDAFIFSNTPPSIKVLKWPPPLPPPPSQGRVCIILLRRVADLIDLGRVPLENARSIASAVPSTWIKEFILKGKLTERKKP